METLLLAWRNTWRNRRRTLITILAMSFSLMLVQAFHNLSFGVYAQMVDSGVRAGSGHIAVYRGNYASSRDDHLFWDKGDLDQKIAKLEGVKAVLPRLYLPALAQSSRESRGIMLTGIDPVAENAINPLLKNIDAPALIKSLDGRDALLGSRLLTELKLKIGNKFVVTAQGPHGELISELLRIRGVITSGIREVDGSLVMVGLKRAASITGDPDAIHELAVILENPKLEKRLLPLVAGTLPPDSDLKAVSWQVAMANLANAIKLDHASQEFIFVVIVLIVTIGVVNTLLMAVMERIREFGVILAVGATPGRLRIMVMTEALLLGTVSMLLGNLLGALATWYLADVGIDLRDFIPDTMEFGGVVFDPVMRASWDIAYMLQMSLYILVLSLVASLYPAAKAARIAPAAAMRHH
ncbi:ABC transporter permease [Geopsychrobacter electrodiphilus]|uniref:ABC transporter permease n=1 Tax=Geopsychrobacter electrodiphilus TaxID=225196 RepID=UPI00037CFAEE|nr:FtsX-like permease family protein [Geopsychrobacter electrodiphilus]